MCVWGRWLKCLKHGNAGMGAPVLVLQGRREKKQLFTKHVQHESEQVVGLGRGSGENRYVWKADGGWLCRRWDARLRG